MSYDCISLYLLPFYFESHERLKLINISYSLNPVITHPEVIKIQVGYAKGEYLLIENRQPIGFEVSLPKAGLVIYHIDENAKFSENPGFLGQIGWPENGNHYRVAIIQSDVQYNLEKGENRGDELDIFDVGDVLDAGNSSYPNTDSYRRGLIKETGIRIYDIVKEGDKITFSIQIPEDEHEATHVENSASKVKYIAPKELSTTFAADIGKLQSMKNFSCIRYSKVQILHLL